ncbi:hypothetical protein NQ318_009776 [Aromia moschata]|uniref:ubiquitinyl hydrolase 1 n=1 Tax=Aromia moschata TaxID=1265417 RepID=A0AAV8Y921_9CUCU|nr:hypothetical protein NQ318_009776 [Aromia moschata]
MSSNNMKFGIFEQNALLKDISKGLQRTVLLGQIVKIDGKLTDGKLIVRLLKEGDSWESTNFSCSQETVIPIAEKLCPYIASITSPQARVKLARNKELCEKLKNICKDMVVGFLDTNDISLGTIKYMGTVKGMGFCVGIELHEKKKNNNCSGSCANIKYFSCAPGHGIFTTIEKILPSNYPGTSNHFSPPTSASDLDLCLEKNLSSIANGIDIRPHHEEIVTKYGESRHAVPQKLSTEYKRQSMPIKNARNSRSLQNILDVDKITVNTNNDFDQNTVIQPDKTYLVADSQKKGKNKSEIDLIEIIGGTWSGSTDSKQLESFSNFKKTLDKNDNIKEKYVPTENNTFGRRNKSMNPLSHLTSNNTLKRTAKFYTNDIMEYNREEPKMSSRKLENAKKINEKSEQLARSSTFYVNDKPKYQDPEPGTTNDLVIGSLVEVLNDISDVPLYGVVRWMGIENGTNFILVGVELEEEHSHLPLTLTDGTHNGERLFKCADNRALFVSLDQCHMDLRFQEGGANPGTSGGCRGANCYNVGVECPVIPGAVAPLCMPTEEDVEAVCGKYRGIQGHHNSCYLDVTLFSMFTYTAVFDSLLFRPKGPNDIDDYEEASKTFISNIMLIDVQRVLREEIVNPLRKNLFVSADHVMKLRRLLDKLSSVSGLTSEEKDPEEFLNSLLAQILKAEPFLKLNSGQEAFHYQLFVEKDADLTLPTVQQLFEQSFLTSNIKLKEVPSCLIIQMPRFGKNYKMYPRILPSQLLDVTDIIEGSPRQCIVCGKLARYECRECFDDCSNAGLESTAFCLECLRTAHRHERRKHHSPTRLEVADDFSTMQDAYRPPRLFMELFAVICIESVALRGVREVWRGPRGPLVLLRLHGRQERYEKRTASTSLKWWRAPTSPGGCQTTGYASSCTEEFPLDRHLPEHARRLLCDAYICMYQSSDVMMYR